MSRSHPLIEPLESRYAPASLSITPLDASKSEGTGGTKTFTFQVTLSEAPTGNVTVAYGTGDGTATQADGDYFATAGLLTFSAGGALTKTISVVVNSDTKYEPGGPETFKVSLFNPSGATLDQAEATGTITDDDVQPTLTVTNGSIVEGQIGGTNKTTFTLNLSNPSSEAISITLSTEDGTGAAGAISTGPDADFVAKTQTITFAPGETSKTFTVDVNGDTTVEKTETFKVNFSKDAGSNVTLPATTSVTGTIVNDDASITVTDVRVVEGTPPQTGTPGQSDMVFTVVLDRAGLAANATVTVDFATMDDLLGAHPAISTAGTDQDYVANQGTLTFGPGETTKQIVVKVNQDTLNEPDETLKLHLSNANGAALVTPDATGTIINDEIQATIAIGNVQTLAKKEGEFTTPVVFTVTLSAAPTNAEGVDVSFVFAGSATSDSGDPNHDYDIVSGTSPLHFAQGETTKTITINVLDDNLAGADETIQVNLTGATNATVGTNAGATVIVQNDDGLAGLSVQDVTVAENVSGAVATLHVTLSKATESDVTFFYSTALPTGSTASTSDFTSESLKSVTIPAGQLGADITVAIVNDDLNESDETFHVVLSNPSSNASVTSTDPGVRADAVVTIQDDGDAAPTLSGSSIVVTEGDNGTKIATFTLSLSGGKSGQNVSVHVKSADGTAVAGEDYLGIDQVVTFAPGVTTQTVSVVINGDTRDELDENFTLNLSEVQHATLDAGSAQLQGKILNDDLRVFVDDVTIVEGNSGTKQAMFRVHLSAPSLHAVDVTLKTSGETATDGTDFAGTPGSGVVVSFAPGQTEQFVAIDILGDTTPEAVETFLAKLSDSHNALIGRDTARGTISNDDATLRITDAQLVEGGPGATATMQFTVTLENAPAGQVVEVDFQTVDGTAIQGLDYTSTTGHLVFAVGETQKTISVPILGDSSDEGNETFTVKLSNPSGIDAASLTRAEATGTIVDDERPIVTISDAQLVEGDDGTNVMVFFVTVTGTISGTFEVNYFTQDGTATGLDYTAVSADSPGSLQFTSAETKTISIPIVGDKISEGDQTFFVKLTTPSDSSQQSGTILNDTAVGTIHDNDALPSISISGGKLLEPGAGGQTEALFTITLSGPSDSPVTVKFNTQDGTATAGSDYTGIGLTEITFAPGQLVQTISVPVLGDDVFEGDETIQGVLSSPTHATIGTATGVATIQDLVATILNAEANEGDGTVTMTVKLNHAPLPGAPVTVNFLVSSGTAVLGTDFNVATTGAAVTFTDSDTATISFNLVDDARHEGDETFTVKLVDSTGAAIGNPATGTFTIHDNETAPTISIADQWVYEGGTVVTVGTPTVGGKLGGPFDNPAPAPTTKNVQFTVTLSGPSDQAITVKASSLAGNAEAGEDFVAFSDQLITFAPGETSKTVTVAIYDDQVDEGTENFKINLSGATYGGVAADDNVAIARPLADIAIVDDDLRGISISDASIVEGANGISMMTFTVSLSAAASQTVTVKASTIDGTATSGVDFDAISNLDITFAPGETSKTFQVAVHGDADVENDELFAVKLSGESNAVITDGDATGRIVTDEVTYQFDAGQIVSFNETNGDIIKEFTVTRIVPAGFTAAAGDVQFTTVDGTAISSGSAADFAAKTGTVHFPSSDVANSNVQKIQVVIHGDQRYEGDEAFKLKLTSSTGGTIAAGKDVLDLTIQNDDARPTLSIGDVKLAEGNSGSTSFVFTVSLSAANDLEKTTVSFDTIDGTAVSAEANGFLKDYVARTGGTLTFLPGVTSQTIVISVNGDTRDEVSEETFSVKLSNAKAGIDDNNVTDVVITKDTGVGTIVDDDATPTLTFDGTNNGDITVVEGNNGTTTVKLKLKLSAASERDVSVNLSLVPDTATLGTDFTAVTDLSQPIHFAPGQTEVEVEFSVKGDTVNELNESFTVKVDPVATSPVNVIVGDATAKVTITNDDPTPSLSINDVQIQEGNSGQTELKFTVSVVGTSDRPITVDFATFDGTATAVGLTPDYIAKTGTITFEAGDSTSKTITVLVNGDINKEADETFTIKLSNASNATIADDTGTGTILQDGDTKVVLEVTDAKIVEGKSGATAQAIFTVKLSGTSDQAVTFTAATRNGSAVAGSDYTAVNQSFTIPAGSTSTQVTVSVTGDNLFEATESFFLALSGVSSNAVVVDGEGRGTIYNDDIQVVNAQTIRYVDTDGDLVTVKITKGVLSQSMLTFKAGGSVGGQALTLIDFTGNPASYNGTSLSVTAAPQPGFLESGGVSDGKSDVGFIQGALVDGSLFQFSRGIDFTNVTIDGDLGGMTAGDAFVTPSIRGKLTVDSLGAKGATNLPGSLTDNFYYFLCKVNGIKTKGDVLGSVQVFGDEFGDIGKLEIGGALKGVSSQQPGKIVFTGTLANATIGKIIGSSVAETGLVNGASSTGASIGSIRVLDGIVGGSGNTSGTIVAQTINNVSVGSRSGAEQSGLIGGGGQNSGAILAQTIGSVTVGSDSHSSLIQGGSGERSGLIRAESTINKVTVFGDITGGGGTDSGELFAGSSLGSVRVTGSLNGGAGTTSGTVLSNGNIGSVAITKNLTGGSGSQSGLIHSGKNINSVTIGSSSSTTDGNLVGGSGQFSGLIDAGGDLSKITIFGSLRGGTASSTGGIQVSGQITDIDIRHNLEGGNSASASASVSQTGYITADRIARMTVGGDITSGLNSGVGLTDSGAIRVRKDLASLVVNGSITGNTSSRVVIAGAGTGSNHLAIGSLSVHDNVSYADILGGYAGLTSKTDALGLVVSADAQINKIEIGGNVLATNIVTGAKPGTDGRFGTSDDASVTGTNAEGQGVTDDAKILATIAELTIKGGIVPTTESYGVVAQYVKTLNVADFALPVTTVTPGGATTQEVQQIDARNAGTFRLSFGGQSTAFLPASASAADVQAALSKLVPVTVTSSSAGVYDVTFTTPSDVAQIVATGTQPPLVPGPGNGSVSEFKPIGGSSTFQLVELHV